MKESRSRLDADCTDQAYALGIKEAEPGTMRRVTIALLMVSSSTGTAFAESMRCGKWVVNEASAPTEVLEKCGEPQQKEATKQDVVGKNTLGNPIVLGVQTIERWYYKPSTGSLPMLVTIVDGKIKTIERTQ
jgi:Protein of unknown function (DUF2845)